MRLRRQRATGRRAPPTLRQAARRQRLRGSARHLRYASNEHIHPGDAREYSRLARRARSKLALLVRGQPPLSTAVVAAGKTGSVALRALRPLTWRAGRHCGCSTSASASYNSAARTARGPPERRLGNFASDSESARNSDPSQIDPKERGHAL